MCYYKYYYILWWANDSSQNPYYYYIYIHTYYWEKKIKAVVHALYWNCIDGKCSIKKEYHYFYVWTLKKMINKIPKTSTNGLFLRWIFSSRPGSNKYPQVTCWRSNVLGSHVWVSNDLGSLVLGIKCPGVNMPGLEECGLIFQTWVF